MTWRAFQRVARGRGGIEGIRIGHGIRFHPFGLFGALGGRFGTISLFWGSLLDPYDFPYYIPSPQVWLCCVVYSQYFILSSGVGCVAQLKAA